MTALLCTIGCAPARPANRKGRPPTALRVAPFFGLHSGGAMSLELRKAAVLLGLDAKAGWPLVLTADQLFVLQIRGEAEDAEPDPVARCAFRSLLEDDIKSGELAHTTTQVLKKTTPVVRYRRSTSPHSWDGGGSLLAAVRSMDAVVPQQTKPALITHINITARDFCAWLQRNGVLPSALVSSWFKAAEVDTQPATVVAMPTVPQHTKRIPQKSIAPDWDGHRLLKRQQEFKALGLRDFTARVAKESGLSEREVTRRIKAEVKPQSAKKSAA